MIRKLAFSLTASLLLASSQAALAQGDSATGPSLGGGAVPGVCMISQQAVLASAKVGLAATARLKAIASDAESELAPERTALERDARALEGQRSSLKPAEMQQRQQALETRLQALRQKTSQREREIEATRRKALGQVADEAQPVIAAAYKARACGLLIDRNSVLGGNMANDLTGAVVQGLDAKITTITFDRETLPAQAAGPAQAQ